MFDTPPRYSEPTTTGHYVFGWKVGDRGLSFTVYPDQRITCVPYIETKTPPALLGNDGKPVAFPVDTDEQRKAAWKWLNNDEQSQG